MQIAEYRIEKRSNTASPFNPLPLNYNDLAFFTAIYEVHFLISVCTLFSILNTSKYGHL